MSDRTHQDINNPARQPRASRDHDYIFSWKIPCFFYKRIHV